MSDAVIVDRLLDVMEKDILPKTEKAVLEGHKIFGAAILLNKDLTLIVAGTNHEGLNPMWHGEVFTIKEFYDLPHHPMPEECIFFSTHEPCSMCLSALAWCGFRKVYFLFAYEETRDDFDIPDDIRILHEIFYCSKPSRKNSYLEMESIMDLIENHPSKEHCYQRIALLKKRYVTMSEQYFGQIKNRDL